MAWLLCVAVDDVTWFLVLITHEIVYLFWGPPL